MQTILRMVYIPPTNCAISLIVKIYTAHGVLQAGADKDEYRAKSRQFSQLLAGLTAVLTLVAAQVAGETALH